MTWPRESHRAGPAALSLAGGAGGIRYNHELEQITDFIATRTY